VATTGGGSLAPEGPESGVGSKREAHPEPRIAGTVINSLQKYLHAAHGPGAFDRVMARVSAEDRSHFAGIVSPLQWYPTHAALALMDAGRDLFGPHDFHERYGASSADDQIHTIYRFLLRLTSPTWMINRGMSMWSRFHNTGVWKVEGSERSMRGTLRDFAVVHAPYCRVLVGWIWRASQITGAPGARVWHPECRAAGKSECVFIGRW